MGLIVLLCALACTKVTLQGLFAKKNVKSMIDGVFFNGLIFLFSMLTLTGSFSSLSVPILLWGFAFGIFTVLFQMFYIKAMACGNVSTTALIVNLSMVFPILVSLFLFDEKLSVLRMLGIGLTVITLLLSVQKTKLLTDFWRWLFYSLGASVFTGAISVCQLLFGKSEWKAETSAFVCAGYIWACFISLILFLIMRTKGDRLSFSLRPSIFLIAGAVGAVLAIFQFFNTIAASTLDATLLFPVYNGGTLILATISGVLIFKDKLSAKQKWSVGIGILAIVLMNL